mmetsp:Transcript_3268/g.5093  ORF Transcript_3268/g.5093 Transcript_3268/m.5093 type:complete len:918 (-) Transcript_3268:180-2933(-)
MWCSDILDAYAVNIYVREVGALRLVIGLLYVVMMFVTACWIHRQKKAAELGDKVAVNSVIFPLFLNIMWFLALSDLLVGLLIILVPTEYRENASTLAFSLYPIAYAIQHMVLEGVAFLLMQHGCGSHAAFVSIRYTLVWCAVTLMCMYIYYASIPTLSPVVYCLWSLTLIGFYFLLWVLPVRILYRRAACVQYAKFWCVYRSLVLVFTGMILLPESAISEAGSCGYTVIGLIFYAVCHPMILYSSLLADSRWWQGIVGEDKSEGTMRAPLLGVDLSLHSAQVLAGVMDKMKGNHTTRLLNFAHIHLDKSRLLGQGSFSKVYRGSYKGEICAIKLIFTMDVTEAVIKRAAAEATILSSIQSDNIVKIFGVSVLPPSVCMVLELCAFGSLSEVLRGGEGKVPLLLSLPDRLFLALGCTRGVAALHRLGPHAMHRDIKSFNFLVDEHMNAKLADLELGLCSTIGGSENNADEYVFGDDFLVNWAPPEVLRGEPYSQSSDIYSLSLVLWEIMTGLIPYNDITGGRKSNRVAAVNAIIEGARPDASGISDVAEGYADAMYRGWADNQSDRPTAGDLSEAILVAYESCCPSIMTSIEELSDVSIMMRDFISSQEGADYLSSVLTATPVSNTDVHPPHSILIREHARNERTSSTGLSAERESWTKMSAASEISVDIPAQLPCAPASLQCIYHSVYKSHLWSIVDSLQSPVVVVTGQPPHLLLRASREWYDTMQIIPIPGHYFGRPIAPVLSHYFPGVDCEGGQCGENSFMKFLAELRAWPKYGHCVLAAAPVLSQPSSRHISHLSVHGFGVKYRSLPDESHHYDNEGKAMEGTASTGSTMEIGGTAYFVLHMSHLFPVDKTSRMMRRSWWPKRDRQRRTNSTNSNSTIIGSGRTCAHTARSSSILSRGSLSSSVFALASGPEDV